ncbi:hypothetical protein [Desulfobacula sp.]|uniref:hypothetical protein n=1 Tax=Desulfobacula sp. TaxID=2593537 RepID=UPI002636A5DB|nr:hypothetical protein [Desulfobacula sp.]
MNNGTPQIFYDIDNCCVDLYDTFTGLIFDDIQQYYDEMSMIPQWVYHTGIDSDSAVSKDIFNNWVKEITNERYYKHLFLADCHNLIGSVQNRLMSTRTQYQNFFRYLENVNAIVLEKDGYYWTSGENIVAVFSALHDLIITMYASLDLLAKLSFQFENMPNDFSKYRKMKCKKTLFGDKRKIQRIDFTDTVFEDSKTIKIIENLRHELIHNGTWESVPKVHYKIEDKNVVEKFIFLPDLLESGTLEVAINRKRFFSNDQKINEKLPDLCGEFWARVLATLNKLRKVNY